MPLVTRIDNNEEISINYEVHGQGEPIVFHHGNGNRASNWELLGYVDVLSKDFQLIFIDSRGYGDSSKPHDPASYSLKSKADDTISVLDELGIEKSHCLGGSVGAATCLLLAKYYPERFKSFIFATPYFTQFGEELKPAMLEGPKQFLAFLEDMFDGKFPIEGIRETFLTNDTIAMWAANSSEWFDYLDYVKYVKVPSLIYVGEHEPSVEPMRELSKLLPDCTFKVLPGLTHVQAYWQGADVAPVIKEYVESLK